MHYRNGRVAQVGDPVVGETYNRKGKVAGVLVSLTPGPDVCSAKVAFLDFRPGATPLAWGTNRPVNVQGTSHHGAQEPLAAVVYAEDFTEAGKLWHADDAGYVSSDGDVRQPPPPPDAVTV